MVTVAASPVGGGIETRTFECLKCHHVATLAAYKIQQEALADQLAILVLALHNWPAEEGIRSARMASGN
jgi:hypothetical protein